MYRTSFATLALAFLSVTASAETITVCASGCDYTSINAAIGAASDGDIIQLSAETYHEGSAIDTLGKAITLRGATGRDGRPSTTVRGTGGHPLVRHIGSSSRPLAYFDTIVFQNGSAVSGGAIGVLDAAVAIHHCEFESLLAAEYGSAIAGFDSSISLSKCRFRDDLMSTSSVIYLNGGSLNAHTLDMSGAWLALGAVGSDVSIVDAVFDENYFGIFAENSSVQIEGASFTNHFYEPIRLNQTGAVIRNLRVISNGTQSSPCQVPVSVFSDTQGVFFEDVLIEDNYSRTCARVSAPSIEIDDCRFLGNTVLWDYAGAGLSLAGSAMVTRCSFEDNSSIGFGDGFESGDGGALHVESGATVIVSECSFARNVAYGRGGAIFSEGNLTAVRCRFEENRCVWRWGSAVFASSGVLELVECLAKGNVSDGLYEVIGCFPGVSAQIVRCDVRSNLGQGIWLSQGEIKESRFVNGLGDCVQIVLGIDGEESVRITDSVLASHTGWGVGSYLSEGPVGLMDTVLCDVDLGYLAVKWSDLGGNALTETCCSPDLNRDNQVNGLDLGLLFGAWGQWVPTADLDFDGEIGAGDIGLLLSAWGPCQ